MSIKPMLINDGGYMREPKVYLKILVNFLMVTLAVFVIFFILPKVIRFFMPFVIGWIVALIANPIVKFLEQKVKIIRKHGSAIFIFTVIAIIIGAFYLIIILVLKEAKNLNEDFPEISRQLSNQMSELSLRLGTITRAWPINIQNTVNDLLLNIRNYLTNFSDQIELPSISLVSNFAKNIAEVFLGIIVTILSAYFFIVSGDDLIAGMKRIFPESATQGCHIIYDNFKTAVGGYFKAQFKIMLVITVIMFIGFEILRVRYSFLLGLGIAFLDFLPVFGTGAVLWPWAVLDMIAGNYMRAIGLIIIYLICQIIKQILQPKLVGDSIGISPLSTLVFMFVGYRLFGIIGMIISIPIGMVIINLYRLGMFSLIIKGFKIILHDLNEFRKF